MMKTIRTYRDYHGMNLYPIDENGLTNAIHAHAHIYKNPYTSIQVTDSLDTKHNFEHILCILCIGRGNFIYYSCFMPKDEYNRI